MGSDELRGKAQIIQNHGNLDSGNKNSSQALIIPLKLPNCVLKAVLDLSLATPSFHMYNACPRVQINVGRKCSLFKLLWLSCLSYVQTHLKSGHYFSLLNPSKCFITGLMTEFCGARLHADKTLKACSGQEAKKH